MPLERRTRVTARDFPHRREDEVYQLAQYAWLPAGQEDPAGRLRDPAELRDRRTRIGGEVEGEVRQDHVRRGVREWNGRRRTVDDGQVPVEGGLRDHLAEPGGRLDRSDPGAAVRREQGDASGPRADVHHVLTGLDPRCVHQLPSSRHQIGGRRLVRPLTPVDVTHAPTLGRSVRFGPRQLGVPGQARAVPRLRAVRGSPTRSGPQQPFGSGHAVDYRCLFLGFRWYERGMTASTTRPVILTVDDDPGVSRSIARDLRRRYGEANRIVRAESPAQALDALKELKLRGEPVALLLADYRMPQMSGIESLEAPMDLLPLARRVLLTAYADTDAAIQAINVVDLDHYLLKPWNPPEEKLYPVVDAMLDLWKETPEPSNQEIRIIGHRWSAPSFAARDFLARNAVPYRWLNVDEEEAKRLLDAAEVDGSTLPVVITPDATVMIAPSESELAGKVGLSTAPAKDFYDLVVVGGGPAGLGAAVYGASEGLRTVLVEQLATGGQAGQSSRIENYLGFPDGVSGAQLTDRARRQAVRFGAEVLTTRDVVGL